MRVGKALCGGVLALAAVSVGCGETDETFVPPHLRGVIDTALNSNDVRVAACDASQWTSEAPATEEVRHSRSPVIFQQSTPPQQVRYFRAKPWLTKLPLLVRTGTEPVDVAIYYKDYAKVGLAYDDWSAQKSPTAAFERIRFMPCPRHSTSPSWHAWAGAIVANRERLCVRLVVRERGGPKHYRALDLGNRCNQVID